MVLFWVVFVVFAGSKNVVLLSSDVELTHGGAVTFQFLFSGQSVVTFSIKRVLALTKVPDVLGSKFYP